jgi:hypothetical protein
LLVAVTALIDLVRRRNLEPLYVETIEFELFPFFYTDGGICRSAVVRAHTLLVMVFSFNNNSLKNEI